MEEKVSQVQTTHDQEAVHRVPRKIDQPRLPHIMSELRQNKEHLCLVPEARRYRPPHQDQGRDPRRAAGRAEPVVLHEPEGKEILLSTERKDAGGPRSWRRGTSFG